VFVFHCSGNEKGKKSVPSKFSHLVHEVSDVISCARVSCVGHSKSATYGCVSKAARACLHKFMVEKNEPTRSPVTFACLESFHVALEYINCW